MARQWRNESTGATKIASFIRRNNPLTVLKWFVEFLDGFYILRNVRYHKYVGFTQPLRLGSEGIGSLTQIKWVMVPTEDDPDVFGYSLSLPHFRPLC